MTDAEELDEESAEVLVRRGPRVDVVFANPARTEAVCADIVNHFYSTIDPLGMKAQVVVFDRAACVAYHQQLTHLLERRHAQGHPLDEADRGRPGPRRALPRRDPRRRRRGPHPARGRLRARRERGGRGRDRRHGPGRSAPHHRRARPAHRQP